MITLDENTAVEDYAPLYDLAQGTVFKVPSGFETVMRRIEENVPQGKTFEVFPINPGTPAFTTYGDSHCVVITNTETV